MLLHMLLEQRQNLQYVNAKTDLMQNRRQKVFNSGALPLCRGASHSENLIKVPLIYSVSYFNFGGIGYLFGRVSPPKPPW